MTTTPSTLPPLRRSAAPAAAQTAFAHEVEDRADATWVRPALIGLLVGTAVLYLWGLGASGWANDFYSAAAQAGSQSWKAFFFGSSDAANSITVDKPPLSLWAMALSVRLFGLSAWSILVPQALMGVASVGVLYATIKRWFGAGAGLLAGAILALTPIATLMFRFNNPDALLVLLLTVGAYAVVRATEAGKMWWLVVAGSAVGFGFLTKMLQALLVVPAFAAVYLLAAPIALSARLRHLLAAGAAMVLSTAWWVAIVELWPASSRPYIGGSQHNSMLELIFGYNGFGRLTGNETGSVGGGARGQGAGMWGETSWHRMFDASWAGQIAWLIPAAVAGAVVAFVLSRRAARTDRTRAAAVLWGGWLMVTLLTFSYGKGIIHEYYAVALAPAIAALVAVGGRLLWLRRERIEARAFLAAGVLGSAIFARSILNDAPNWHSELQTIVVLAGALAATLIMLGDGWHRRAAVVTALVASGTLVLAPAAYSLQTAATAHGGALPTAGPAVAGGRGGPGGRPGGPAGAPPNFGARPGMTTTLPGGGPIGGGRGGGPGGLLNASTPSAEVVAALTEAADRYTWVAAAVGSNSAAGYQLAAQKPVMAIGGFNGSDPSPSLEEFKAMVAAGKIHWFIGGGGFGPSMGGSQSGSAIAQWVSTNFTAVTIGGVTMYDLSAGA